MALILVVEDDDRVRVLAEAILQDGGHTTLSASTADQALALLDGGDRIDVLFTDLSVRQSSWIDVGPRGHQAKNGLAGPLHNWTGPHGWVAGHVR